jgi:hypothetical protein
MLSHFYRAAFIAVIFLSLCNPAKAQSTYPYYFAIQDYTRQPNSLYNKISLVDLRIDTLGLGFIQTGAFNKRNTVVPKAPIRGQVNFNLASQIDDSAGTNELLLQLRELNFSEITGAMSENGFFKMRASLFAKTEKGYRQINTIDTIVKVSAMDVSNALLKKGGQLFAGFIASKLTTPIPAGSTVTYNDIAKVDSIEKSQIKVFTTDAFVDGYYVNYNSFKNQIPDGEIFVKGDDVLSGDVKIYNEEKKLKNLKPNQAYAIVHKGTVYLITTTGYSPVIKVGSDLIFISRSGGSSSMPVYYGTGGALGGALFGLAAAATTSKTRLYKTKIDHINGSFVTFEEVTGKGK